MLCVFGKSWVRIVSSNEILEKPHDTRRGRCPVFGLMVEANFCSFWGQFLELADGKVQMGSQGDIIMYVIGAHNDFD